MIFLVIQNASDQKTEMEKIKGKMAQEVTKIEERKAKIDDELKEVQVSCLIDLCSQYKLVKCHHKGIKVWKNKYHPSLTYTTAFYLFHTYYPGFTYPFFTSVSLYLIIAAL